MKNLQLKLVLATMTLLAAHTSFAQGHYHLYIGATAKTQGAPLAFDDQNFLAPAYGFVQTLNYTNGSKYAGYFQPGGITTAVLAATGANGGPVDNSPALGSQIAIQLVSAQGPTGGAFGFWEANALSPTISLPCGTTNGTNFYIASQNGGAPGTDPFGHIHGRAFTANVPGVYTVGVRALDVSTNGTGGGPIHTPSGIFYVQFQAGVTISGVSVADDTATVTFGATGGKNLALQYATTLGSTNWQSIGDPVGGDDHWHTLTDLSATNSFRIYRVAVTPGG